MQQLVHSFGIMSDIEKEDY